VPSQSNPPRHVVITGAGSGLGRELALVYARRGDRVALIDIHRERADAVCAELRELSTGHSVHLLDVSDANAWLELKRELQQSFGHIDVLINNAGIASSGDFIDTTIDEWQRVMAINTTSVHLGCHTLLPLMLGRKGGVVINTASFAGLANAPDTGVYGVAKAAVVAYSEILRGQLFAHGIRVSCLCPSFFQTNLLESFAHGHERMKKAATKLMEQSAITARDVAEFTVRESEKGVFLLLPHKETVKMWRAKRWLPEWYFKRMLAMLRRDKLPAKSAVKAAGAS
jgi:short-subunit dehydrogenase